MTKPSKGRGKSFQPPKPDSSSEKRFLGHPGRSNSTRKVMGQVVKRRPDREWARANKIPRLSEWTYSWIFELAHNRKIPAKKILSVLKPLDPQLTPEIVERVITGVGDVYVVQFPPHKFADNPPDYMVETAVRNLKKETRR